jgi:hypothetical protein
MMKITLLFYYLILSFFVSSCTKKKVENISNAPINVKFIAKDISDSIRIQIEKKFPIITINSKNYSKTFWSFFDSSLIPNKAFADFNNDGLLDYGWVVSQNNQIKIGIAVSNNQSYNYWLSPFTVEQNSQKGINTSISVQAAGRTDLTRPVAKSLVLKNNAFIVNILEQPYCIIYILNNDIQIFTMQ